MQDDNSLSDTRPATPWEFPENYFSSDEKPDSYLESGESELSSSRSRSKRRSPKYRGASSNEDKPALELSPERWERKAKNVLLHQLSRQAKSTQQLREVLEKREVPADIAEKVLERFTEAGLINDQQFAITVALSRRQTRGLSTAAIRRELVKKGVGLAEIEVALSEFQEEDELATAIRMAEKRLRALTKYEPLVQRRRVLGFLARKGYSGGIAYRALKEAEASLGN